MSGILDQILGAPAWLVLGIVGLIVFAEDALFLGFVIPGETAAILGGVAANRGHVPLAAVIAVVIAAAVAGPSTASPSGSPTQPSPSGPPPYSDGAGPHCPRGQGSHPSLMITTCLVLAVLAMAGIAVT